MIKSNIIKKSLVIWLLVIPCAILNGGFRDLILTPILGEYALPASGIMLSIIIFILCLIGIPRMERGNSSTYKIMGIVWIILTIAFEFIFGNLIMNKSIPELIKAYDITTGNLWLIVVILTGVYPFIIAKIKKII